MNGLSQSFPRAYRTVVSAFVLLILGAQAFNVLCTILQKNMGGAWYWPIIDYPMYAMAGYEGESVDSEYRIVAVLDDGTTRPVSRDELGLNVFHFGYLANGIIRKGGAESIQPILGAVSDAPRIREIRVMSSGRVITRNGIEQQTPVVLGTVSTGAGRAEP